jgi:tRNA-dihydrouridine synthase B
MKLILAPLQGVTEYPFRNAWSQFFTGLDEAVSPFLPVTTGVRVRDSHLKDVLPQHNRSALPLVPQLLGNEAVGMSRMAHALANLGYSTINLNMGCPSNTVARKQRGCGLMPHPERVDAIMQQLFMDLPIGLSVKIRCGMHSADELWPMLEVLNRYPLKEIILHPRLGVQQYGGTPDLESFARALKASRHPLVYNGDINTPSFFAHLRERFPSVNHWMLGRGVLMNPYLPGWLKGLARPSEKETRETLFLFQQTLLSTISGAPASDLRITSRAKEYWNYFSHWFLKRDHVWISISRAETVSELKQKIDEAFALPLAIFD